MEKKEYIKPVMEIVELSHSEPLLQDSGEADTEFGHLTDPTGSQHA